MARQGSLKKALASRGIFPFLLLLLQHNILLRVHKIDPAKDVIKRREMEWYTFYISRQSYLPTRYVYEEAYRTYLCMPSIENKKKLSIGWPCEEKGNKYFPFLLLSLLENLGFSSVCNQRSIITSEVREASPHPKSMNAWSCQKKEWRANIIRRRRKEMDKGKWSARV